MRFLVLLALWLSSWSAAQELRFETSVTPLPAEDIASDCHYSLRRAVALLCAGTETPYIARALGRGEPDARVPLKRLPRCDLLVVDEELR